MPVIYITDSMRVRYSPEDAALVLGHRWWLHRTTSNGRFYAYTFLYSDDPVSGKRRRQKLYLHRAVTQCPTGYLVDHADGDGLNNARWNLRITTGSFNNANQEPLYGVIGYRGVTRERNCRYRARTHFRGEDIHIGMFDTAREAALAYDAKARELFGEFAWTNFDCHREKLKALDLQDERDLEEIPF